MTPAPYSQRALPLYLGIFLISWSALTLEISLIRLLAVSYWYHFAWMVISLALLGLGAGGTFLNLLPHFFRENWTKYPSFFSILFSVSALGALGLSRCLPFDPLLLTLEKRQLLYLIIFYLLYAFPFFFFGAVIALILRQQPRRAGKSYAANLFGSALGCLSPFWIFQVGGGMRTVTLASLGGAGAAFCFSFLRPSRFRWIWLGSIFLFLILALIPAGPFPPPISEFKGLSSILLYPDAQTIFQGWNELARVDVVQSRYLRLVQGLSLNFRGELPRQLALATDGDNLSPINHFAGEWETVRFCDYLTSALPYHLLRKPRVLIIGPGGGTNLLTALYHHSDRILGLELNPLVVELMKGPLSPFSGSIYNHPAVRVLPEEGRSFFSRTREKFDLIQIPLLDSCAAASSGVSSLTENYLYTVESFQSLYQHLHPGGMVSITRWLRYPPRDALRIFATAIAALRSQNLASPELRLAFIRGWATGTILMKRGDFSTSELENILNFCRERGFDPVHLPGTIPWEPNRFNRLKEPLYFQAARALLDPAEAPEFIRTYPFDISPVRDEKPFFYDFLKFRTFSFFASRLGKEWMPLEEWGYLILLATLIQASLASFVLVILPHFLRKKLPRLPGHYWLYFIGLGLGYLFLEIGFIQKLILFLGHPVYAVSAVIFSLLVFSSLGSWFADRLGGNSARLLGACLAGLLGVILLYIFFLPPLLRRFFPLPPLLRFGCAALIMAPPGFLMGIPFPSGLKMVGGKNPNWVSWAWAINGCASVIAAVLAEIVATAAGFSSVLILAGGAYALTLASLGMGREAREPG